MTFSSEPRKMGRLLIDAALRTAPPARVAILIILRQSGKCFEAGTQNEPSRLDLLFRNEGFHSQYDGCECGFPVERLRIKC